MTDILVISKDDLTIDQILKILAPFDINIHRIEPKDLLINTYILDIKLLIIDIDCCDKSVLEEILYIKEKDYMPTIGIISSRMPDINDYKIIKYIVDKKDIPTSLIGMAHGFIEFKQNYDNLKECFDTTDTINSKIDGTLRNANKNIILKNYGSIQSLLQNSFIDNKFLKNKPSIILVSTKNEKNTIIDIYYNNNDTVMKDSNPIILKDNISFGIDFTFENAFFSNYDEKKFSDIGAYEDVFEEEILQRIKQIKNFTGFGTADTAIIGINYKYSVTSLDAKLIKGLCISLNVIKNISNKIDEVNEAFIYTMNALARAGEAADDDTGNHIKRVNEYSSFIATKLGMDEEFIQSLSYSAQMHDVGKIHIPPEILKKLGKLTDEEFEFIKKHTEYGAQIIGNSPHLKMAYEIAKYHHERFDGTGYPDKISGDRIPLSARIVMLADIYDALRSKRSYKIEFSHEKTYDIIVNGDGRVLPSHFDPKILEVFIMHHQGMNEIFERLK